MTTTKGNELPIQITACMELKSVISHMKDYIFNVMSFIGILQKAKLLQNKSTSVVVQEGGGAGLTAKGLEALLGIMKCSGS